MTGGSLQSLMMRSFDGCFLVSVIPYSLRLRFCSDICSGVTYLHHNFGDERIIHGDIKPANILLSKDLDCKIADFGGATIATISDNITQPQPRERGAQETLGYIAPERKSSDIRLSKAMDVYSVGATFYLILQREHPAKIQTDFENQLSTCTSCREEASQDENAHFDFLKHLMMNCCHVDPAKRSRIMDMRDSLTKHMRDCGDCSVARVTQHVASIAAAYKVNNPTSEFSKPKVLSNATFQDFAYHSLS